ncbi:MAG: Mpv17/PMP22 family protein, partial [Bacteroidales bacterium]|nr:Mpv17/PMP22 family protein [Bacteroidales bacterium]
QIIVGLNWKAQWSLVFKKYIPLFWFPAHTITFLLPANLQVLFAALLGVVLGVMLSIANLRKG